MMKRIAKTGLAAVLAVASMCSLVSATAGSEDLNQTPQDKPRQGGTAYRLVENWLKPGPGQQIGGVSWVSLDRQGNLFAFRRCPIPCPEQHPPAGAPPGTVVKIDPSGKFLNVLAGAKEAHGAHVDREGFVWTTDVQEHTVKKYRTDGTLVMTLGTPNVAGTTPSTFNQPTDVIVGSNGDVFVADGYGNQRIVKFSKDGKFLTTWGTQGSGPGQLRLPHALVLDSHGRLIVADRCGLGATQCKDNTIAVFDTDGKFLDRWQFSAFGLAIDKDDRVYAGDIFTKKIFILDSRTGKQLGSIDNVPGMGHSNAVDWSGDNVYLTTFAGPLAGVHRYTRQ